MADQENSKDVQLLKRTRISVFVDEALPDILVVTFEFGVKIFKGVLLDSTKRNLPCGVPNVNPAFNVPTKNPDDDTLYSVNQRFAYTDPTPTKKKNVQISSKYKNPKMTVRLRPRQVLCSNCKGVCNENSENVSRKRKASDSNQPGSPAKRSDNAPATRASYTSIANKRKTKAEEPTLVPKLTRLTLQECKDFNVDNSLLSKKPLTSSNNENSLEDLKNHSSNNSECGSNPDEIVNSQNITKDSRKKIPRKKRLLSTAEEDVWEEPVSEESKVCPGLNSEVAGVPNCASSNTRTIKISYGPQGEGTVLKIPAKIETINESNDLEENVNVTEENSKNKDVTINKAARKALKKAKKEAKRKVLLTGGSPPIYLGNNSPRYVLGTSSPRYTVGSASPRHGLGNNSPRYISTYDINHLPRRRKHKMKHKKKHKDEKDKKHKDSEVSSTQDDSKDTCVTQKLSINLKRLHKETYTSSCQIDQQINEDNISSSDEHCEQVPDFPPSNPPLMLRINAHTLSSAIGADGVRLLVGDVVWGKIHGFPWWPGKILTITSWGNQAPQAHVSWYGSSTSSLMLCDQLSPYLENFKIRYNKKKRGPYKEAIKQASLDARENAENRVRQPLGNSPSHNIFPQVVPPALASPREIDVVS